MFEGREELAVSIGRIFGVELGLTGRGRMMGMSLSLTQESIAISNSWGVSPSICSSSKTESASIAREDGLIWVGSLW